MANETLYAGIADLRTAEALTNDYLMLAADRSALQNHPALHYSGDALFKGSNTWKVPHVGLMGYDLPVDVADGAEVPNTALSDGSSTVAVTRRSKSYGPSDLAKWTDSLGILNPQMLAQDAFASHQLALTSSLAGLMGGFSNTVATTGVDLSIASVLAGLTLLEVGFQGAIPEGAAMGILHTVAGGDFRTALATATGGALQWNVPAEQLVLRGPGYRGRYLGVDWFISGYCPTANAGADRAGGIFVRGAVTYGDMSVQSESADQIAIGGKTLFERDRQGRKGVTDHVSHSYHGASEGIDDFGVTLISDA